MKQIEPINESEYSDIFYLLNTQFHANFGVYKIGTVSRRIQRRMQLLGIERLDDYATYLSQNNDGLKTLYQYLLIGVTEFFRDMDAFTLLEKDVIPDLFNSSKKEQLDIRIWVTACSTGEEAYSIALLFKKYADTHHLPFSVKIFASDIFPYFIQKAKRGCYTPQELAKVPKELLNKYFIKHPDHYEISADIKNQILFTTHNLLN